MGYTPDPTWADGQSGNTPITAAKLNNIETGIVNDDGTNPLSAEAIHDAATFEPIGLSTATLAAIAASPISGNAATATKLATARTINGTPFDGTANIVDLPIAVSRTTSFTAVAGHNPADATSGTLTVTLPTGLSTGTIVSVEKVDATSNGIAITGNIRGVAAATINLVLTHETVEFRVDSSGSFWPIAGHKTLGTLDARYPQTAGVYNGFTGRVSFGPNGVNKPRVGWNSQQVIASADVGTGDHVAHAFNTQLTGSFVGDTGVSAPATFGMNVYSTTGTNSGDGAGANPTSALIEMDLTSNGHVGTMVGLSIETSLAGVGSSGGLVDSVRTLKIQRPHRKDGAQSVGTPGVFTTIIGIDIDNFALTGDGLDVGFTTAYSLLIRGGYTQINGHVDFLGTTTTETPINVKAFAGNTTGALLTVQSSDGTSQVTFNADGRVRALSDISAQISTAASFVKIGAVGPSSQAGIQFGSTTTKVIYQGSIGLAYSGRLDIGSTAIGESPLVLKGFSGQTASLLAIQNSGGGAMTSFLANGALSSIQYVQPGNGSTAGTHLYSGSGAPSIAASVAGDLYVRTDTPSTANQRIYIATATNTWTGII